MNIIVENIKKHWQEFLDDCYKLHQIKEEADDIHWPNNRGYIDEKMKIFKDYMLYRAEEDYYEPINFEQFYLEYLIKEGICLNRDDFINSKFFNTAYMHELLCNDPKLITVYEDMLEKYYLYDDKYNEGRRSSDWEDVMS